MADIKPLVKSRPAKGVKGGRPTKWYAGIHKDYEQYRKEGISHKSILMHWRIQEVNFTYWLRTDHELMAVYSALTTEENEGKAVRVLAKSPVEYTKEALRTFAFETLQDIIVRMKSSPTDYKASEIIAACREALDRTEGKASQSITVDAKQSITHEYILSLDPDDAYRMLIERPIIVSDYIDITPEPVQVAKIAPPTPPGGIAADGGPGGDVGEETPDTNTVFWK